MLVNQITAETERRTQEIFEERRRKREAINRCDNENEKALLMRELAMFEERMQQQIREETSEQDAKLQQAL